MSISVNALQSHINTLNGLSNPLQALSMGNIELTLRADLVRFYNFSISSASALSESELYVIMDNIENGQDPFHTEQENFSNTYEIICTCGSEKVKMEFTDMSLTGSQGDGYDCKCASCKNLFFIHESYMDIIIDNLAEKYKEQEAQEEPSQPQQNQMNDTRTIEEIDFSARTYNTLKRANINTVNDILKLSLDDLMFIQNMGNKSILEMEETLSHKFEYAS